MRNPHEHTNPDAVECRGCGEEADGCTRIQGTFYDIPLCRDCHDDLTCLCPSCDQRIWQARGTRLYATSSLYCDKCSAHNRAVAESVDADLRADEQADSFNERRR